MAFEATLQKGGFWKKVVDSMKDLVSEANFECNEQGMSIQAVDTSHVALVSLSLLGRGFDAYECHRQQVLGVNLANFAKLLKISDDKDSITLRHQEDTDNLVIVSDSDNGRRTIEFSLKLMEIEGEAMGVPENDSDYQCYISMPSDLFAKTCREMTTFGDTLQFDISKERVRFSGAGDLGEGNITILTCGAVDKAPNPLSGFVKAEGGAVKAEGAVKTEGAAAVKPEPTDDDASFTRGAPKAAKTGEANDGVFISCKESMQLSFALRYLATFSKGAALSDRVVLALAHDQPCRVEYQMAGLGSLRWYLAPKVDDEGTQ